jgi:hypothetical protein
MSAAVHMRIHAHAAAIRSAAARPAMKPVAIHRSGMPTDPDPPDALVQLSGSVRHPLLKRCGLTTTPQGRWALYVTVPADATVPIADIESQAHGFPVVYEAEPARPPGAWPARPGRAPSGR